MSSELVQVGTHQLERLEWEEQPVVTFEMIDEVHQRPEGTAARAFRGNKIRFTISTHYFSLNYQDIMSSDEIRRRMKSHTNQCVLITEAGYLRLCKVLSDDLAWDIQERLINAYFRYKEFVNFEPKTNAEILLQYAQELVNQERRIAIHERMLRKVNNKVIAQAQRIQEVYAEVQGDIGDLTERVDFIEGKDGYYTIVGFASSFGYKPQGLTKNRQLGKEASARCRTAGIEIRKVFDARYGEAGAYPTAILKSVFDIHQITKKKSKE